MSVEVKNATRSKGAAEWKNIMSLYRVYGRQNKWFPISFVLFALFHLIFMIIVFVVGNGLLAPDDLVQITGMSTGLSAVASIFILITCFETSKLLTNQAVSMYPGTVKTRFLSRMLYDLSYILFIVGAAILFQLADLGVYQLIASAGQYAYSNILFDGKTFLMRCGLWLGYLLLCYGVAVLLCTIATKIGNTALNIAVAVIAVMVVLLVKFKKYGVFIEIYNFYKGPGLGFGTAFLRCVVTVFICLLLSYLVMCTIHSWKQESTVLRVYAIVFCYIMGIFCGAGIFSSDFEDEAVTQLKVHTLEEDLALGNVIVDDRVLTPGVVDARKLNESYEDYIQGYDAMNLWDLGFSVGWCEYEEAKIQGLISDQTQLGAGEILVRVVAPCDQYKDIGLFDGFIHDLGVDIADSKYVVTLPKKVLLYDDFLSSMDDVLGSQAVCVSEEVAEEWLNTINFCHVYMIYHEGDVEAAEELHNYDMCNVSHTWYLDEDTEE